MFWNVLFCLYCLNPYLFFSLPSFAFTCWSISSCCTVCSKHVALFFSSRHILAFFFCFSIFACYRSFLICVSSLIPTKVKVRSPDGDTEYFDIVAGVLQGDTLAPYLFIICLDYVLRTSIDKIKENGFELTKKRSRRYPATTITDADYADDIAILANTPDQAETLLHSLERAAASIGLHVNAHKTEYMCYNQTGDISTLEGTPLKLQIHVPRKQRRINRKGHRNEVNESMDSYQ